MAKSDSKIVAVCDAGPIIHLDELNCLDLLSDFHSLLLTSSNFFNNPIFISVFS